MVRLSLRAWVALRGEHLQGSTRGIPRVLDLGCGDGALTAKLLESRCDVVGIDGSVAMVTAARNQGFTAHVMDAQALPFVSEFTAVLSYAALR